MVGTTGSQMIPHAYRLGTEGSIKSYMKSLFDMFRVERYQDGLISYYPKLSVRMYRADEYNLYLVSHMSQKGNLDDILLSGESELKVLNASMDDIYHELIENGILYPNNLSEKDVIVIKREIASKSYTLSSMQAIEEKVTPDHPSYPDLPKKLQQHILSGNRAVILNVHLTDRDRLVLNSLSIFIGKKMMSLCIGSDYFYDENLPADVKETDLPPKSLYLAAFLNSILIADPCCIGCYINLSLLIPYVNREHLLFRLGEHISSPEIHHLLRSFLNINIIKSMDGRDVLWYSKNGLIRVGTLTMSLFDFLLNEFDFHLRKSGYFCTRVEYDLFIGVPTHFLEKSSVDVIKDSVYNNIRESLAKIKITVDALDELLSCYFFKDGESIPLFGGDLLLHNNTFYFVSKNRREP